MLPQTKVRRISDSSGMRWSVVEWYLNFKAVEKACVHLSSHRLTEDAGKGNGKVVTQVTMHFSGFGYRDNYRLSPFIGKKLFEYILLNTLKR